MLRFLHFEKFEKFVFSTQCILAIATKSGSELPCHTHTYIYIYTVVDKESTHKYVISQYMFCCVKFVLAVELDV